MAEYSRTKKYQNLRDSLQNDSEDTSLISSSKELSRFEKRLNQIDANTFSAPKEYNNDDYVGNHVRNTISRTTNAEPLITNDNEESFFDTNSFRRSENFGSSYENDYLDQYIKEVKDYNIAQGNAISDNTTVNVLHNLHSSAPKKTAPTSPYPNKTTLDKQPSYSYQTPKVSQDFENTADLPFISPNQYGSKQNNFYKSDYSSDNETQSKTKEDIMAEVQNLVNNKVNSKQSSNYRSNENTNSNTFEADTFSRISYDSERNTRQQLLNETTQMRAQLDDYEDNLSEVTDKMRRTNNILNIVLIVLIIALVVILGIVIYIITLSK